MLKEQPTTVRVVSSHVNSLVRMELNGTYPCHRKLARVLIALCHLKLNDVAELSGGTVGPRGYPLVQIGVLIDEGCQGGAYSRQDSPVESTSMLLVLCQLHSRPRLRSTLKPTTCMSKQAVVFPLLLF